MLENLHEKEGELQELLGIQDAEVGSAGGSLSSQQSEQDIRFAQFEQSMRAWQSRYRQRLSLLRVDPVTLSPTATSVSGASSTTGTATTTGGTHHLRFLVLDPPSPTLAPAAPPPGDQALFHRSVSPQPVMLAVRLSSPGPVTPLSAGSEAGGLPTGIISPSISFSGSGGSLSAAQQQQQQLQAGSGLFSESLSFSGIAAIPGGTVGSDEPSFPTGGGGSSGSFAASFGSSGGRQQPQQQPMARVNLSAGSAKQPSRPLPLSRPAFTAASTASSSSSSSSPNTSSGPETHEDGLRSWAPTSLPQPVPASPPQPRASEAPPMAGSSARRLEPLDEWLPPVDDDVAPVDADLAPVDADLTPDAPVDADLAPVDANIPLDAPLDADIAPVDAIITPDAPGDADLAPVDADIAPLDADLAPVDPNIPPADIAPVDANHTPDAPVVDADLAPVDAAASALLDAVPASEADADLAEPDEYSFARPPPRDPSASLLSGTSSGHRHRPAATTTSNGSLPTAQPEVPAQPSTNLHAESTLFPLATPQQPVVVADRTHPPPADPVVVGEPLTCAPGAASTAPSPAAPPSPRPGHADDDYSLEFEAPPPPQPSQPPQPSEPLQPPQPPQPSQPTASSGGLAPVPPSDAAMGPPTGLRRDGSASSALLRNADQQQTLPPSPQIHGQTTLASDLTLGSRSFASTGSQRSRSDRGDIHPQPQQPAWSVGSAGGGGPLSFSHHSTAAEDLTGASLGSCGSGLPPSPSPCLPLAGPGPSALPCPPTTPLVLPAAAPLVTPQPTSHPDEWNAIPMGDGGDDTGEEGGAGAGAGQVVDVPPAEEDVIPSATPPHPTGVGLVSIPSYIPTPAAGGPGLAATASSAPPPATVLVHRHPPATSSPRADHPTHVLTSTTKTVTTATPRRSAARPS
ncbi:hypothetical protein PAPYR_2512 [Paratrimastix pyriformis]|uniref:Uncharacterized protein n=1 Tax=Paratrimastix pyriformis TaxID=342808 RepID=A0ABQ8UPH2_9EUKA|nr:hypothetical protein PAPYR_2512 [Paratrimastix pyriformis]